MMTTLGYIDKLWDLEDAVEVVGWSIAMAAWR